MRIRSVWHNTFDDILGNAAQELATAVHAHFGAASLGGHSGTDGLNDVSAVDLLTPGGTMEIDILKMPHHGSARNMVASFLQRVRGKHYVFSGRVRTATRSVGHSRCCAERGPTARTRFT